LKKDIDIVCVGEILIDFIGLQLNKSISQTSDYRKYLGGSPSNVAMNMAKLGLKTTLVGTVGDDGLGNYIIDKLNQAQIDTQYIEKLKNIPTSAILISRTLSTPEFIPFRKADYHIKKKQVPNSLLKKAKIFHTSCFALSKNTAQKTILLKAQKAVDYNCRLSIDINYSDQIWSSKVEAIKIIKHFCQFDPLVKISMDDVYRLFGSKITFKQVFSFFHNLNVEVVCLTLGSKGVKLSQKNKKIISLPAIKIDNIMDVTGAGDAFWAGFLTAFIKKKSFNECLEVALQLAALKLQNIGDLPNNINLCSINAST